MVATDLDGTLLRRNGTVSPFTGDVLRRVQDAGATVVIATARAPWSTQPVARDAGIRGLAVCMGGAAIYDIERDEIVEHDTLSLPTAHRVVELIRDALPDAAFACSWPDGYAHEPAYRPAVQPPPGTPVGDVLDLLRRPVHKLTVKHHSLDARAMFDAVEEVRAHASISYADDSFIEILASGVSKASALQKVCDRLGVRSEEVVAFGDYPNDAAMLAWAGHGVAVANAHEAVLAVADEVAPSNEDDGVAVVLERLLNDGKFAQP